MSPLIDDIALKTSRHCRLSYPIQYPVTKLNEPRPIYEANEKQTNAINIKPYKNLVMKGKYITTQIILACLSSGKKQVKLAA
jgi:hypothetical protein